MQNLDSIQREGRARLYPSIANPSWLILRRRREIFRTWLSGVEGETLKVLDVGGRVQPYRELFEGRIDRYVALDLRPSPLVTVASRAEAIPVADAQFDLVICTQVLQYVAQPAAVIAEIYRVLKPGGGLLLSAPAIYLEESERDLWRFTSGGLRLLLGSFRDLEIRAEGSSFAGLVRSVNLYLAMLVRPAFLRTPLRFTAVPMLNVVAALLEKIFSITNDQFAANFSVLAKK